jgi:hypothetical protein
MAPKEISQRRLLKKGAAAGGAALLAAGAAPAAAQAPAAVTRRRFKAWISRGNGPLQILHFESNVIDGAAFGPGRRRGGWGKIQPQAGQRRAQVRGIRGRLQ